MRWKIWELVCCRLQSASKDHLYGGKQVHYRLIRNVFVETQVFGDQSESESRFLQALIKYGISAREI